MSPSRDAAADRKRTKASKNQAAARGGASADSEPVPIRHSPHVHVVQAHVQDETCARLVTTMGAIAGDGSRTPLARVRALLELPIPDLTMHVQHLEAQGHIVVHQDPSAASSPYATARALDKTIALATGAGTLGATWRA